MSKLSREGFLAQAALSALTGLLSNPNVHEEQMRWEDLSAEAWAIAENMLKTAPVQFDSEAGHNLSPP